MMNEKSMRTTKKCLCVFARMVFMDADYPGRLTVARISTQDVCCNEYVSVDLCTPVGSDLGL